MKTAIKTALAVVAGAAAIAGVATVPSIVSAWGDSEGGRQSYSLQYINEHAAEFGNKPFFNSITIADSDYEWYKKTYGKDMPEGIVTHEKNYVGARENTGVNAGTKNVWQGNDITVEDGKTYIVRLYVHNNNPNGEKAVAENTKVRFNVPTNSSNSIKVNGFITSSNATPNEYVDYVNFNSDRAFHLEYIDGSALIESNGKVGGSKLGDNIVDGGVLIGYDALDGRIPGCYQYDSYITIEVKAVFDYDFTVENKVRIAGDTDKTWKDTVVAKVGDKVEFQIQYRNTSNKQQDGVAIKDILPANLKYVAGSTKIMNSSHPNGAKINEDYLVAEGMTIGNYGANANAFLMFTAEVVNDELACGNNTLVNWAQAGVGDMTRQDYARVVVNRVCENTDEPVKELPNTGPEAIAGSIIAAGSIATAAGYYIVSRRQLR